MFVIIEHPLDGRVRYLRTWLRRDGYADLLQEVGRHSSRPGRRDNNVIALAGIAGGVRIRVGDWRVSLTISDEGIDVFEVAARGSAYR